MWYTLSYNGIVKEGGAKTPTLSQLQEACGGYVQDILLPSGNIIWCNEEGKLLNLPYNEQATSLWWDIDPKMTMRDTLQGNIVFEFTELNAKFSAHVEAAERFLMQYDTSVDVNKMEDVIAKLMEEE